MNQYEPIIGLEVHIQLNTVSKMFCGCSNMAVDAEPNTLVCPVCFGMPGTLPVANKAAVEKTLLLGRALKGNLAEMWNFERKNYFYPDLPKGYQITSSTNPPIVGGTIEVPSENEDGDVNIRIHHIHLEEDAGKLSHGQDGYSYVDLNRAGTPLIELVTEPDFREGETVKQFLQDLRLLVRSLGISDGDMENGHLRCDANVSLRLINAQAYGVKVEIKNLNSFAHVEKAIKYEIERQSGLLNQDKLVNQETRSWNENKAMTEALRTKEGVEDYRYMPEPDIPPIVRKLVPQFSDVALDEHLAHIELPAGQLKKLIDNGINLKLAQVVIQDEALYRLVSDVCIKVLDHQKRQALVTFIYDPIARFATEHNILLSKIALPAADIVDIYEDILSGKITHQLLKMRLADLLKGSMTVSQLYIEAKSNAGLDVEALIKTVIDEHPTQVAEFKAGNQKIYGFLVGQIMARSRGQADPKKVNELLKKRLGSR